MKTTHYQWLFSLIFSVALLACSSTAFAERGGHGGGGRGYHGGYHGGNRGYHGYNNHGVAAYHGRGYNWNGRHYNYYHNGNYYNYYNNGNYYRYYNNGAYYNNCSLIAGYWANGIWFPARTRCW